MVGTSSSSYSAVQFVNYLFNYFVSALTCAEFSNFIVKFFYKVVYTKFINGIRAVILKKGHENKIVKP